MPSEDLLPTHLFLPCEPNALASGFVCVVFFVGGGRSSGILLMPDASANGSAHRRYAFTSGHAVTKDAQKIQHTNHEPCHDLMAQRPLRIAVGANPNPDEAVATLRIVVLAKLGQYAEVF